MKKISLLFLLSCISAGSVYAMEWGASSPEELLDGLRRERELLRDTMRALPANKEKTDAQLNTEMDADLAPDDREKLEAFMKRAEKEKKDDAAVLEKASSQS